MATGKAADTLSGEPLKDLEGPADTTVKEGADAVKTVASAKGKATEKLDPATQQNALDWFISSEPIGGETTTVRLNVGTEDDPKWIDWKLRAIELDSLRTIRKRAANSREARRTGNIDEFRVNLEIVASSTVEPDLNAAADALGIGDPVEALRQRFYNRPGYITQLAGKVLTASGFDEEDVQDAEQVAAAGNS